MSCTLLDTGKSYIFGRLQSRLLFLVWAEDFPCTMEFPDCGIRRRPRSRHGITSFLGIAFLFEGYSWRIAHHELMARRRYGQSLWRVIRGSMRFNVNLRVRELETTIDRLERKIRRQEPEIKRIFIEAESLKR